MDACGKCYSLLKAGYLLRHRPISEHATESTKNFRIAGYGIQSREHLNETQIISCRAKSFGSAVLSYCIFFTLAEFLRSKENNVLDLARLYYFNLMQAYVNGRCLFFELS
jgi:hypothetical protein